MTEDRTALLSQELVMVETLRKYFPVKQRIWVSRATHFIHAVDDVSFAIQRGELFGLVGESGCGKTTAGKLLVKLLKPTSGSIYLEGEDVAKIRHGAKMRGFRRKVQMIFQDPYESLNPRFTIYDTIAEPLAIQGAGSIPEREERVADILAKVGLTPPETFMFRYPHELSGGQRQRVAIARAMVIGPTFVVADEPTSMLDVSIRAGVMKLLLDLREEFGVSYLYITHDFAVARYMCERMAVMYLGKIVELGPSEDVIQNPLHPYTKALISAVPIPDPTYERKRAEIRGDIAAPIDPPPRCRFYPRCLISDSFCEGSPHPPLEQKAKDHIVACYKV